MPMSQTSEIDLGGSFGPVYWGFTFSTLLSDIAILQAYNYFPNTNDKLSIRFIAGCMIVFDLMSTALIAQSVYYYLIPRFGSLAPFDSLPPGLSAECLIATTITLISQLAFANQIYAVTKMKRNWIVPTLVTALALVAFAGGIGCTTIMFAHKHSILDQRSVIFSSFFGIAKGVAAVTDVVATLAMCYYLSSARNEIGRTNDLINWLMRLIIHRGVLVTLLQTALLIVFYAAPRHLFWLAFHVNVTKLYVNIFFAMLNARSNRNPKNPTATIISIDRCRATPAQVDTLAGIRKSDYGVDHSAQPFAGGSEWLDMTKSAMPIVHTEVVVSDL